jgi:prevent-host-death family protein
MVTKQRVIPAGEFKARCLALLDEVAETHQPIVVTKHGRPVAMLAPIEGRAPRSLRGSILREADLVSPIDERWDAER